MLSPEARAGLRRQWVDDLTAEIARRTKTHADSADAERQQQFDKLQQMADGVATLAHLGDAEAAEELVQAKADWSRIDEIRLREASRPPRR